jgi:DNA-binding CsgD family transcriptional regulator/N-acetylneuraminic acid mutarotase
MTDDNEALSEREIEILRLVATGVSNKEIAVALDISPNTVKVHLRNIFTKIGVMSRTEATLYAIRHAIVEQPGGNKSREAGETAIFAGSPMAIAQENPFPSTTPDPSPTRIPSWVFLFGTAAVLVIGLLVAALLLNARAPATGPDRATPPAGTIAPRWTAGKNLPAPSAGMGITAAEGLFYIIGGGPVNNPSAATYQFDPRSQIWKKMADKPTPVTQVQSVLIQEKIYVPGGLGKDGKPSQALEVYDPRQNRWDRKADLPVALSGCAAAAYEGNLYIFGGWDGKSNSDQVYIYSPDQNQWEKRSPLPAPRVYAAAAVLEGQILIIGGSSTGTPLADVTIYFPARDGNGETPWEAGPDLPAPRSQAAAVALANMVYLFGGESGPASDPPPALVLEPDKNNWTAIDAPPTPPGAFPGVLAAGNFIHLFGGLHAGQPTATHQVYQAIYTISIPLTNSK